MPTNDNAVNIKNAKKAYHHGDLRAAAIAEGLKQLEAGSLDALSLREIARNVGVSATALYRHFPDKQALMSALAVEGGRLLAAAHRAAFDAAGGGRAGFIATGRAYVRFALANPALFRLVMSCEPTDGDAEDSALTFLRDNIRALLPAGASGNAAKVMELRAWAGVHGLAMLMLDGLAPADDALIDAVISADGW